LDSSGIRYLLLRELDPLPLSHRFPRGNLSSYFYTKMVLIVLFKGLSTE
jgi:hypothetical protein